MEIQNHPETRTPVLNSVFKQLQREGNNTYRDGETDVVEVDEPTFTYVKRYGATRAQIKARRNKKK